MSRQLELLAEDLGQLVERDLDLEHVLARALARLALRPAAPRPAAERVAGLAVALARRRPAACRRSGSAGCRSAAAGSRRVSLPFFADHLALRDVLAQVLFDLAADDLAEAAVVVIDLLRHHS